MSDITRRSELLNNSIYGTPCEPLTEAEMEKGWHYCWDWDGMFITPEDKAEWNCCTCDKTGVVYE